ncbi:MAG: hypothetical protein K2H40_13750 [Lachnospiraceae bacterium]|nr:hypothetical protein [Lachnospiraceae bacterium]
MSFLAERLKYDVKRKLGNGSMMLLFRLSITGKWFENGKSGFGAVFSFSCKVQKEMQE